MGRLFSVVLDASDLLDANEELANKVESEVESAIETLSAQTHAHIVEYAMGKLHTRRDEFLNNLHPPEQLESGVWLITLDEGAMWIDDGIPSGFDMLPGLLASPKAKEGKNGKYITVPFKHSKGPTQQTAVQQALTAVIKSELKKRKIPYKKIERNPDGSAKLGLLHKMDISNPSGKGFQVNPRPEGQEGPGGRHYLMQTRIYQRQIENVRGKQSVQRDIMTFRTASEKHKGRKWIHPGVDGIQSMENAEVWANQQLDSIIDELTERLGLEK